MTTGDTIVAISSAAAPAARMIVRASGAAAHAIASRLSGLLPPDGAGIALRRSLTFAGFSLPGCWVYLFRAPRSYTGEDLAEFHVPGNPLVARMLLDDILRHREARQAEPGEFTARAYFNGRLDLAEAEGVAATIAAAGEAELRAARQLRAGELSRRLRPAMDLIAETAALVEVGIDFSDEDVTFLSPEQLADRVDAADRMLAELVAQSGRFERLVHEPSFVLIGRPNAGKSTLLNALARQARAVVSPVAGTTRDVLSAEVALEHGIVRVLDVAGLEVVPVTVSDASPQADVVRQMHSRALAAAECADFVVLVQDVTDPRPPPDFARESDLRVLTKADLAHTTPTERAAPGALLVSAASGQNLDRLRGAMNQIAFAATFGAPASGVALTSRHLSAIAEARAALHRARAAAGGGAELAALELREALDALGRVLGRVSPDDLLGQVFSSFCIGK
jgi:tRNA modification GTPase